MPITIQLDHVALIAGTLSAHASNLGSGIKATLHGNHLRLWQEQAPVFEIRVDIQGKNVTLNRAETPVAERGRGWGRLGVLLALRWAMVRGCTTANLGTPVAQRELSFWGGLQDHLKTSLQAAVVRQMQWIAAHVPQPTSDNTSVMIIRDRPLEAADLDSAAVSSQRTANDGSHDSSAEREDERLLFLPGASGNIEFWRPVAQRLSHPGERCFISYPGFGGVPADPHVCGFEDLISRVASQITGPTSLLAQSMGGMLAVQAALLKPELVRSMVLTVTSGGVDVTALGARNWRPIFRRNNPHLPTWFEEHREDLSERIRQVRSPVLLLWGDADPISPVAVGERLAELFPCAELVVLRGGTHDLALERSDEVATHIERFYSRVRASTLASSRPPAQTGDAGSGHEP